MKLLLLNGSGGFSIRNCNCLAFNDDLLVRWEVLLEETAFDYKHVHQSWTILLALFYRIPEAEGFFISSCRFALVSLHWHDSLPCLIPIHFFCTSLEPIERSRSGEQMDEGMIEAQKSEFFDISKTYCAPLRPANNHLQSPECCGKSVPKGRMSFRPSYPALRYCRLGIDNEKTDMLRFRDPFSDAE